MPDMTAQEEREAFQELEEAFKQLKSQYHVNQNAKDELKYAGNNSGKTVVNKAKKIINDAIEFVTKSSEELNSKLKKEFPDAYKYAESLPDKGKTFLADSYNAAETVVKEADMYIYQKNPELYRMVSSTLKNAPQRTAKQGRAAIIYLENEVRNMDRELSRRYPELYKDIETYFKKQYKEIQVSGIYHPWGTEYRRKIGVLIGLRQEVDNLYELGLASLLHSKSVKLGGEFIDLLRKDPEITRIDDFIRDKIINRIKTQKGKATEKISAWDGENKDERKIGLGGKRHPDNMLKQLTHLLDFGKYKATWEVGFNKLTWTIRHCTVHYEYVWLCKYNKIGYTFVWKVKYSIDNDTLDLRPHSANKLDFNEPYNIITSILGSAYHDIIGGSDSLKVSAEWNSVFAEKPERW